MPQSLHIVVLGDSLAFGAGDESDGGIANRLDRELRGRGVEAVETVNLGVNGAQSTDVLARLEQKRVRATWSAPMPWSSPSERTISSDRLTRGKR